MRSRSYLLLFLGVLLAHPSWADLTMRHTLELKFGSFLPPAVVNSMKSQVDEQLPKESVVEIKGKKVRMSIGRLVMIADYDKGVITLLDPRSQQFATSPLTGYADRIAAAQKAKMPVLPPQVQQMLANMQFDAKS